MGRIVYFAAFGAAQHLFFSKTDETMYRNPGIALVALVLMPCLLIAQNEFVVSIDPQLGTFEKTGPPLPGVEWIYPNVCTFDETAGTYYFAVAEAPKSLCGVRVADGTVVSQPTIDNILEFQYNNTTGKMYAMQQLSNVGLKQFVEFNAQTGMFTPIGDPLPGSALFQGFSTFDEVNNRYIILTGDNELLSINAATGMPVAQPMLSLSSGQFLVAMDYNNTLEMLYGILFDGVLQKYLVCTINPADCTINTLGNGTTLASGNGNIDMDETNGRLFLLYSSTEAGGYAVTTFDVATGGVLYHSVPQPFVAQNNLYSLKYDHNTQELYALHWESFTNAANHPGMQDMHCVVAPNPLSSSAVVRFDNPNRETMQLSLYTADGRLVTVLDPTRGNSFRLDRGAMVSGMYVYRLFADGRLVHTGKVVVE